MRGLGSELYNTLGHLVIPKVFSIDAPINIGDNIDPGYVAGLIGEKFIAQIQNGGDITRALYDCSPSEQLSNRLQKHTFGRTLDHTLAEGIRSSVQFPINILQLAEARRPKSIKQPLYKTFNDFMAILRSEGLANMLDRSYAASTSLGIQ